MGGGKSLFLLIVSLFFVNTYFSSCAKEEVAPDASTEAVAAKKKGEGSLEKDLPGDCNCYMQILSIDGHDDKWIIEDITAPLYTPGFKVLGMGQTWMESGGNYVALPTPFLPLAPPDAGCHKFKVTVFNLPEDQTATLFTKVICCQSETSCSEDNAATTTYHQFSVTGDENPFAKDIFHRKFACTVLIAGEDNCDPRY